MSKRTRRQLRGGGKSDGRISVRAIRRDPPDLKKLSQALIALALAEAAAEADAPTGGPNSGEAKDRDAD